MRPNIKEDRERPTPPKSDRPKPSRAFTSVVVSIDVKTGKRIDTWERHHETAELARRMCEKEVRKIKGVATRVKGWGKHLVVYYRDNETTVCTRLWPETSVFSCPPKPRS